MYKLYREMACETKASRSEGAKQHGAVHAGLQY